MNEKLIQQHKQHIYNSTSSFYNLNNKKISSQTFLGQLIDRSDYYPSNAQLQPQACYGTEGGIDKKGKNSSKFWNRLERQVSKIESEKDFKLNNIYDTPHRIGTIEEEYITGRDPPLSPCSKKSQFDTLYTGSMLIHPNSSGQNYDNLQGQIGMASPSLGISSATSPSKIKNLAFQNTKTNSVISGNKMIYEPIKQAGYQRVEIIGDKINNNRHQQQSKYTRPNNLLNIQVESRPLIVNRRIDRLETIVSQPSTARHAQVPIKPRPFQDKTSSIISNTRDTQFLSQKHYQPQAAKKSKVQNNKDFLDESVIQLIDAKKLIRNGCRAARFALIDLLKFFTNQKESSGSQKRSGSCGSKFSKGERPRSAIGSDSKNKRVQIAKKYFDINQSIQNPSANRRFSNNFFYKQKRNQIEQINQPDNKIRALPFQMTQEDKFQSQQIVRGGAYEGFRRTSCPPKARQYARHQNTRNQNNQQRNYHHLYQQQKRHPRRNQISPLSISQINSPFSLDQLSQQEKVPLVQKRIHKPRPDQIETITYQEKSEQKGEYTIPRIQYMRQLSTSSPNYNSQEKSNDLSQHQSVTRNRTPGRLMQDVQKNQQQNLKRRSTGSVYSSSLGYRSINRINSNQNTGSITAPQTARFLNSQSKDVISPRAKDRGRQIFLHQQNNNYVLNSHAQLYSPTLTAQVQNNGKVNEIQIIDDDNDDGDDMGNYKQYGKTYNDDEEEEEEIKGQNTRKISRLPTVTSYSNRIELKKTPDTSQINNKYHHHQENIKQHHQRRHSANDYIAKPSTIGQQQQQQQPSELIKIRDEQEMKYNTYQLSETSQNTNSKNQIPLSRTIDLESLEDGLDQYQTPTISAKVVPKSSNVSKDRSKKSLLKNPGSDDLTGKFSDKYMISAINQYKVGGGVGGGAVANYIAPKSQGRGLAGILSRGSSKSHQANNK